MTETARVTECSAATLFVAFELGSSKWVLAFAVGIAQRPRIRTIVAGDLAALQREVARARACLGVGPDAPVASCYEAGREGVWLHRWVRGQGIASVVVDSSSIEVNRRRRRAKTDRLDAGTLLTLLQRGWGGERYVWSVVQVPTPEAEAARQLTRELATVRADRLRIRNRIQALLVTQGVRLVVTSRLLTQLATVQTGDGAARSEAVHARVRREYAQPTAIEARLTALQEARATRIQTGTDRVATVARTLCRLRGVAEASAALYSAELFGTRRFANGRQLGALTGLVPVPYRSDQSVVDQGISKAGRRELRRVSIQLAWGWLRWQPASTLSQWFQRRFALTGKRSRRIGIVAVARKLVMALWRFVEQEVIPEGACLKATS